LESLLKMDPFQFEFLVAELLTRIGYEKVEVTKRSGDKGIDITAHLTVGGLTNVKTVIQVKRYNRGNNISGKFITQLRGNAEVDQRGLIITTSNFTRDAINESKAPNKMPVALVNGEKLLKLLFDYRVGVKEETVSVFSIDNDFFEDDKIIEVKSSSEKSRSLWPLPRGTNSFIETLNLFLKEVNTASQGRQYFIKWFLDNFDNVNSEQTARGYINVPKNMGLIYSKNGIFYLTEDGNKYIDTKDLDFLYSVTSKNILVFDEIYQFLLNSNNPQSDKDILEYLKENFNIDWSTLAQVNFRLMWLINFGKINKNEDGYQVTNLIKNIAG